jgi:hypothetical protein
MFLRKYFLKHIRIYEEAQWKAQMAKKPKLRTYVQLKNRLKIEKYLFTPGYYKGKSLMFQLRSGTNSLEIERGRYLHLAADVRYCTQCDSGDVEMKFTFFVNVPNMII